MLHTYVYIHILYIKQKHKWSENVQTIRAFLIIYLGIGKFLAGFLVQVAVYLEFLFDDKICDYIIYIT